MVWRHADTACHQNGLQECTVYGGTRLRQKQNSCTKHICTKLDGKFFIRYRHDPVSAGNTFQDLRQLRETADNTERYTYCGIRVTNINMVKFIDQ
jgi:hypothetical protein